jgi:hypothetical protein
MTSSTDILTRIKCSLSSSDLLSQGNGQDELAESGEGQVLEKRYVSLYSEGCLTDMFCRIANIEDSLDEMKRTLASMCSFMQDLHSRSTGNIVRTKGLSFNTHFNSPNQTTTTDGDAEYPHLLPLRTETAKSAPIMMVRKFRPDSRRLYRDRGNDIIENRLLSEDVANCLVSE